MLIIGAEAALPAGGAWRGSVVAPTGGIFLLRSLHAYPSDAEHPCDPLLFEMGGCLLTYA